MRLRDIRRSRNIDDRRRATGGGGRMRGGGALGGLGIGGVLLVLAIGYFTGIDVTPLLTGQGAPVQQQSRAPTLAEDQAAEFTAKVLATTEDVWSGLFPEQAGKPYRPPTLVLFSTRTNSPCGGASGATGPFYCPIDRKAYLDTEFFATLSQRLGAKGDFAAAYVVAHEVAHHVQNELGILGQVMQQRQQVNTRAANALTVRLELQADCLSGIWARNVRGLMDRGDLAEALNAARMIGDDRLQRQAGRAPQPHTFTHGTSAQRAGWFERGYDSGRMSDCDTFSAARL